MKQLWNQMLRALMFKEDTKLSVSPNSETTYIVDSKTHTLKHLENLDVKRRIKVLMSRRRMTYTDIAIKLDCTSNHVGQMLSEKRAILGTASMPLFAELLDLFGMKLVVLMTKED